jgi:hypothetical protein
MGLISFSGLSSSTALIYQVQDFPAGKIDRAAKTYSKHLS